jgi:hypothetical protein
MHSTFTEHIQCAKQTLESVWVNKKEKEQNRVPVYLLPQSLHSHGERLPQSKIYSEATRE